MARMKEDWTPRHRGLIYCSPRCGGNCTRAAWNAAKANAARLAKDLGPGWKPWVWENLGWHYAAQKGAAEVHEAFHGKGRRGRDLQLYWNNTPFGQILIKARSPRELRKKINEKVLALREAANALMLV